MKRVEDLRLPVDLPSLYVTDVFAEKARALKITRKEVPTQLAPDFGACEVVARTGYLDLYREYTNELLNASPPRITSPTVRIDKQNFTSVISNSGRGIKTEGVNPLKPGNEAFTPPPLMVIRKADDYLENNEAIDGTDWLMRVFVNAFPYALPRKETTVNNKDEKVETVCGLSFVVALNPEKKQLHDPHFKNTQMFELLLYTISEATRLIKEEGSYVDAENNAIGNFDAVFAYINEGPRAGGSLSKDGEGQPHAQIIALPKENAQPFYLGEYRDAKGFCDRCRGAGQKIENESQRLLGKTKRALAYVPKTEGKKKGRLIRITSRKHINDFPTAMGDPQSIKDLALLIHTSIRALALAQLGKNRNESPSFNVVFAQDTTDIMPHMFIDVMDGVEEGGWDIVGPIYRVQDSKEETVSFLEPNFTKPSTIYGTPESIAQELRDLVDFPREDFQRDAVKPGRYAKYYPQNHIPASFRSYEEILILGKSSLISITPKEVEPDLPNNLVDWPEKKLALPQIRLIPPEKVKDYFENRVLPYHDKSNRDLVDTSGRSKSALMFGLRSNIAEIDWVEQTYGITIDIPQDILDWLGEYKAE